MDLAKYGLDQVDVRAVGRTRLRDVLERLSDDRFRGIVAVGPKRVSVVEGASLPILAFVGATSNARIPLLDAGLVAVTRAESGETWIGRIEDWKEPPPAPPAAPPDPKELVGRTYQQHVFDAVGRLPDIVWRAGTLLVRIIVHAERSNDVRVPIEAGVDTQAPEVRAFLERMRGGGPSREVYPRATWGQALPSYVARKDTPPAPDPVGLALEVPRVALSARGESLVVRGSFTLPIAKQAIPKPDDAVEVAVGGEERRRAIAVVPITLLLTGPLTPDPEIVRLRVPSFELLDGDSERPRIRGYFAVDLFTLREMPRVAQDWSVYGFADEHLVGPLPLTLVSRDMAPGPNDR